MSNGEIDYECKSLYLITDEVVVNRMIGVNDICNGIKIIAREIGDTAMTILSRFEAGDDNIGVVINSTVGVDDDKKVFIVSLNQELNTGDKVPNTTNADFIGKQKKIN